MTLVASPMHSVILNVSAKSGQWLIGNERTMVRCLPVSCTREEAEEGESRDDEEMLVNGFK